MYIDNINHLKKIIGKTKISKKNRTNNFHNLLIEDIETSNILNNKLDKVLNEDDQTTKQLLNTATDMIDLLKKIQLSLISGHFNTNFIDRADSIINYLTNYFTYQDLELKKIINDIKTRLIVEKEKMKKNL